MIHFPPHSVFGDGSSHIDLDSRPEHVCGCWQEGPGLPGHEALSRGREPITGNVASVENGCLDVCAITVALLQQVLSGSHCTLSKTVRLWVIRTAADVFKVPCL